MHRRPGQPASAGAQRQPDGRLQELRIAIPLAGNELDSTQSYEILGSDGEHCLLRSRVERIATRLVGGAVVREQLEQQRQVIAAITSGIEWLDVTCRFAADDPTVM